MTVAQIITLVLVGAIYVWITRRIAPDIRNIRSRLPNRLRITFGSDEPMQEKPNTKQNTR